MKTLNKLFVVLISIGLLQSCITIEENYFFKKDGSGSMEYVIDLSELGEMMKDFEDSDNDVQQEQQNDMDSIYQILLTVEDISNVKNNSTEWIQKLSFDFENIDALNAAIIVITKDGAQWAKNGKRWTRSQFNVEEISSEDGENEQLGIEMLRSMKYKINVKTQKKLSGLNTNDLVSAEVGKKSVQITTDLAELTKNPEILTFSVNVK